MTEERKNELLWLWGEETNDPDTQEWRDELTPEEAAKVAEWDANAERGMGEMARRMLELEERQPSIESRIAAAKAQELRQRAVKLRDATDIVIRLEYIYEAAKRLQEAEDGAARGKDLNNALNALEGQIKAREDRLKKERKQDMALVNAVGDLADSLTDRLPR
jgi:hypothetical protein